MATSAYIPPSVSITEEVLVNTQPVLSRPTSIAIVGETLGYLTYSETVFLDDINAVTLKQSGIDTTTLVVVDALDPSATAFVSGTDYVLSAADTFGNRTLKRIVYTDIPTQTDLAWIYVADTGGAVVNGVGSFPGFDPTIDTDADGAGVTNGIDRFVTDLSDLSDPTNPVSIFDTNQFDSFALQSLGAYLIATDYTTNHVSATSHTVTRVGAGNLVSGQVAYVTYETEEGNLYENEAVTFTGTAAQNLAHDDENVITASVIVTNDPNGVASTYVDAANAPDPGIVYYTEGATGDYVLSDLADDNLYVDRNLNSGLGTALMGYQTNNIAVKVTYNATPTNYYQPTHFFNQQDVEAKFGAALDSNGNINSPASFGAYMAFLNQATDVWVQPLFHTTDSTVISGVRTRTTPSTYTADWAISLRALRDIEEVNVIVPVFARTASSGAVNNSTVSAIFSAVTSHIYYMGLQQQYVIGLFGEDSTIAGMAAQSILQTHAVSVLGGSNVAERCSMVSPASFAFANPQSGTQVRIGGQYVAAAVAGMLSARLVQVPLTRKPIQGVTDVLDFRSESDKNLDAGAGLMVIENKQGVVRVRHSITTAVSNVNTRELSVIRAKNFMIESIKDTVDGLIGQLIADANAPFTVSTTVQGVLEALVADGVIVDYSGLQSRRLADPTQVEVRFSYKPAYPLNYVSIVFSIDTTSGAIDTTQANTTA